MEAIFVADEIEYYFPASKIPPDSLLNTLITTNNKVKHEVVIRNDKKVHLITTEFESKDLQIIYNYLVLEVTPEYDQLYLFDYFNINELHSYELASLPENHMRKNMYSTEYSDHDMNKNNEYSLIKIDESRWKYFRPAEPEDDNLLFNKTPLKKNNWNTVQKKLSICKELIDHLGGNCIVAGGYVFSSLFNETIRTNNDIDVFIYGCTEEEALLKIKKAVDMLYSENILIILRTANAITLKMTKEELIRIPYSLTRQTIEIQIILRLYRSMSEVLHGFDVDCCSLGYDGKDIWATKRAMYSLMKGYNTVNFDRLSPSYESRLAKYGTRGMAVKIPNFSTNKVKNLELENFYKEALKEDIYINQNTDKNVTVYRDKQHKSWINDLKGLDLLIFLDYRLKRTDNNPNCVINTITNLSHERSDYSAYEYKSYNYYNNDSNINYLLEWLSDWTEYENEDEKNEKRIRFKDFKKVLDKVKKRPSRLIDIKEYDRINNILNCSTNNIRKPFKGTNTRFNFLRYHISHEKKDYTVNQVLEILNVLLDIPLDLYNLLARIKPWSFPPKVTFKKTNPGEQMTNTFHSIVLNDTNEWYYQKFY